MREITVGRVAGGIWKAAVRKAQWPVAEWPVQENGSTSRREEIKCPLEMSNKNWLLALCK